MDILNRESIQKVIKNPFLFVPLILLIILALSYSFALGCFIGAMIAIPITLLGGDSNKIIAFFCSDSSWKMKVVYFLSSLLGKHFILIVIISLGVWGFLNFTNKGKELVDLLD